MKCCFVLVLKLIFYLDKAMAARIQTHGVRVSIKRTITPAKYEAKTAYKMTEIKRENY